MMVVSCPIAFIRGYDVINAGIHFGPDTGRDYVELMRFFHMDEPCFMTGIMSNGKRVRVDGKDVKTYVIPHDWLQRIADALKPERGMFLVCFPLDTNLFKAMLWGPRRRR